MAALDPTFAGFFIFGILAGLCPCNSVLCLALIGYVTGDAEKRSMYDALRLTIPFGIGTLLVIVPLGGLVTYFGKSIVLFDRTTAYAIGGIILLLMSLQFFGAYHLPVRAVFRRLRLHSSFTPLGTFLLGLSFGAITIGRVAPMLFSVLAIAALSGSVGYGLSILFMFGAGMILPLVVISSIGGATGNKIRGKLKESGVWLDRLLGLILFLAAGFFLDLAFKPV